MEKKLKKMTRKGQLSLFANPIFLMVGVIVLIVLLYFATQFLNAFASVTKIFLTNFTFFIAAFVLLIGGTVLVILFFKDKIAPKIALMGLAGVFGFFLLIFFLPSIAVATDGVLATVQVGVNLPGTIFGVQTGQATIQSAAVVSEQPNSPVVPTPSTFSLYPLSAAVTGQDCNSLGQCYSYPPPLGFIGLGATIEVQATASCDGHTFYNQNEISENTILSFSGGGNAYTNITFNNLPDHSTCDFTIQLSCSGGVSCSSTPYNFQSSISSVNVGS